MSPSGKFRNVRFLDAWYSHSENTSKDSKDSGKLFFLKHDFLVNDWWQYLICWKPKLLKTFKNKMKKLLCKPTIIGRNFFDICKPSFGFTGLTFFVTLKILCYFHSSFWFHFALLNLHATEIWPTYLIPSALLILFNEYICNHLDYSGMEGTLWFQ